MNKSYHKHRDSLVNLLPSIELLERSREIAEDAIYEIGKLAVETILGLSAVEIAGEPQKGKARTGVRHYGSQTGRVVISGKRMQVDRPRLRDMEGEVGVPAYEMVKRDPKATDRAVSRILSGVSTRDYAGIFDEAGKELGLSKSNVSREFVKGAEEALKELTERKIYTRQLAVMIDGVSVGESLAVAAVGLDESGTKRVLGLSEGASENTASAGALLDSMIERGVDPKQPILFVIDGAKALRKAIKERFPNAEIQRCRLHKIRNVISHLPLAKREYYQSKLDLAYKLPFEEALLRLEEIAHELELAHPGAAASLREGMEETLTVSRLKLPELLVSSLKSTNLIESSFSKAKTKLRRITNYSSGEMSLRWCASALRLAEQGYRTVKGVKDLWMLRAALDTPLQLEAK
jgi:putative transposase